MDIDLDTLLHEARERYVRALAGAIAAHRPCHVEPALRRANGELAVDGELNTPYRVDLIEKSTGNRMTVDGPRPTPGAPVEFSIGNIRLHVHPFSWDVVRVRAEGLDTNNLGVLTHWFLKWFDPEDTARADVNGLYGVVHFISDPQSAQGKVEFTVDFGSAGIDALKELLECLARQNATGVEIG